MTQRNMNAIPLQPIPRQRRRLRYLHHKFYDKLTPSSSISQSGLVAIGHDVDSDNNKPPSNPSNPTSRSLSWIYQINWTIETLAVFFALSSFSVLVVVLKRYNGSTPTAWPFGALTLNGLVAGPRTPRRPLGDLEVFDQASRSVWGSIVLLWRLKGRHLASFAAVLTIVGLAFDLFAQQVITIKARSSIVNITSDANLPQIPRAEALANISNLMTSTFYAGLLSVNATDIIPVCPTGNCTWPVVSSLAMCGGCTDVSAELTAAVDRNDVNGWHNYSLPDGLTLSVNGYIHNQRLVADRTNEVDFDSYSGYRYKSIGNDPENGYLMLLHFEVISFDPNSFKSATPKPPVAHECALWFCIQAYNVSMTNGQLTQSTIGSWRKLTPNHLSQSMMQNFTKTPAEFNVPPNAQFLVAAGSFFERLLDDVFPMSVEQSEGDNTYHGLSQGLWGSFDHRDSYIENFARGLTQAIRQSAYTSPLTDIYYLGTAFKDEVYVKVRWAWLAFPGFMLIGSCLLLLATVWRTGRAPVGPWKDNALALLFAGVDENVQSAARGALRRSGNYLGMAVGDERVRLSEMDGKWKFD